MGGHRRWLAGGGDRWRVIPAAFVTDGGTAATRGARRGFVLAFPAPFFSFSFNDLKRERDKQGRRVWFGRLVVKTAGLMARRGAVAAGDVLRIKHLGANARASHESCALPGYPGEAIEAGRPPCFRARARARPDRSAGGAGGESMRRPSPIVIGAFMPGSWPARRRRDPRGSTRAARSRPAARARPASGRARAACRCAARLPSRPPPRPPA